MNDKQNDFRRRVVLGKKISIRNAAMDANKPHEETEDTKIRREINKIISTGILSKKTRLEILIELGSNPKYQKYNSYFKIWINEQDQKYHDYPEKGKVEDESDRTL